MIAWAHAWDHDESWETYYNNYTILQFPSLTLTFSICSKNTTTPHTDEETKSEEQDEERKTKDESSKFSVCVNTHSK